MNKKYRLVFSVDGKRTEQEVSAFMMADAKKLIEAQYSGHKVTFFSCVEVR